MFRLVEFNQQSAGLGLTGAACFDQNVQCRVVSLVVVRGQLPDGADHIDISAAVISVPSRVSHPASHLYTDITEKKWRKYFSLLVA